MKKRMSFERISMNIAKLLSERSTCQRLKVGTVILSKDFRQVYSWGYNGSASGLKHDCTGEKGKCGCLHSEINAIINCNAARNLPKVLFCTHLPCPMCAKAIINLGGVEKVLFNKYFRDRNSLKLFYQAGIEVVKWVA